MINRLAKKNNKSVCEEIYFSGVKIMAIHSRATVIGLTAPFGSGSTTSASILSDRRDFKIVRLSKYIRSDFEEKNLKIEPTRNQLQTHGDLMRQAKHNGVLAELAVNELSYSKEEINRVVVDGFEILRKSNF